MRRLPLYVVHTAPCSFGDWTREYRGKDLLVLVVGAAAAGLLVESKRTKFCGRMDMLVELLLRTTFQRCDASNHSVTEAIWPFKCCFAFRFFILTFEPMFIAMVLRCVCVRFIYEDLTRIRSWMGSKFFFSTFLLKSGADWKGYDE